MRRRKNPALDKLMIISQIETALGRLYNDTGFYVFAELLDATRKLPANVSDDDLVGYFSKIIYENSDDTLLALWNYDSHTQSSMINWQLIIDSNILRYFDYTAVTGTPTRGDQISISRLQELRSLWLHLWNATCNRKIDRTKLERNLSSFVKIVRQAASRFYPSPVPENVISLVDATALITNTRVDYETLAEILEDTIRSHGTLLDTLTDSYQHGGLRDVMTGAEYINGMDNLITVSDNIFPIKSRLPYAVPILMASKALLGYSVSNYYCNIEGLV